MIDQLRSEIQQRLDQLLAEADELRQALAALSSDGSAPDPAAERRRRTPSHRAPPAQSTLRRSARDGRPRTSGPDANDSVPPAPASTARPHRDRRTSPAPTRARFGETKSAILAALSGGQAMTAGDVAAATGLGRASASTTLSQLAKSGEITKAERGYQRARR
jgi:CRP-like cAMP-binding protein